MSSNKYKELFDKVKLDSSVKDRVEERMYVLRFKLDVGEVEKHSIEFEFDRFWGYVTIKIDGRVYKRKAIISAIKQSRTYEFAVGDKESHNVRISLVRAALPIGYRKCTAWVYVDEKLRGQHDGNLYLRIKKFRDMKRPGKITFVSLILLVLALIAFVITYHMPISIDEKMNGVIIRAGNSETEYLQPINVDIEGEYRRNLFIRMRYSFEGQVKVSEQMQNTTDVTLKYDTVSRVNIGVPVIEGYLDSIRSFGHSFEDGFFYMKPDASAFMIIVFEREPNGEVGPAGGKDGLYYVGPCDTREEALEIINELFQLTRGKKAGQIK